MFLISLDNVKHVYVQDEGKPGLDSALGPDEDSSSPKFPHQSAGGTKKKRHRVQKDKERDAQVWGITMCVVTAYFI